MAVLGEQLEALCVREAQHDEAVGVGVEDAPALQLAGADLRRRVDRAVDVQLRAGFAGFTDRNDLAGANLRVLDDDPALRHVAQRWHVVEAALLHDRPGEAGEDLRLDEHVKVRVIPVGAGRLVVRDRVVVVEALVRFDAHEHVVVVGFRRDVKPCVWRLVGSVRSLTRCTLSVSPAQIRSVGPGKLPS